MRRFPALALILLLVASLGVPACFFGPNAAGVKASATMHAHAHPAGHDDSGHAPASHQQETPAMPDFCAVACLTLAALPVHAHEPDWPEGRRLLLPPAQTARPSVGERIERPPRILS